MKNLSIEELTKLCEEWQNKLGLSHWRIGLRFCTVDEMPLQDTQATNEISLITECALISFLKNEDLPESPFEYDIEVSLVHELLHIPFNYICEPETNSLEYIHMEAFIERVARLLVSLSRLKK